MGDAQTYTYRAGRKVTLGKRPDEFVVRALPERLRSVGIADAEQVSSASSRVHTDAGNLEAEMNRSRSLAPTHHAYYLPDTGEEFLITDRIMVTFKAPPSEADLDAFAARYALLKKTAFSDREFLFQLTDHTGMNPVKLVVKLNEEEPLVETAEHDLNQRMRTYLALPSDPAYARQWHLHTHFAHPDVDPRSSSRCEGAWQLLDHFGRAEVVVGVTDDGCKLDHPDLDSANKFAGWGYFRGERLVTNADVDAEPSQMYKPGANHGTSCAGVIAGEADSVLTVGAAPGCRLLPIQWQSSGPSLFISDSKLLTALNYVADKVDVLSNSWGGVPISTWGVNVTRRIAELARSGGRRGRGIVFLWAAGNENCLINHVASVPVPFTDGWSDDGRTWIGVQTTRRFENNLVGIPGLMHVAALASTARRSHYSNYGPGILICAPTNNVHEYHRMSVAGLGVTTTTGSGSGVTDFFGGTSSATPLVAGIAALAISANPQLTALEVVSILKRTASKDLDFTPYPRTPAATFDPNPTWDVSPVEPFNRGDFTDTGDADGTWSPWFGHGRVDAEQAVGEALRRGAAAGAPLFRRTATPNKPIPDNNVQGIREVITCGTAGDITSVKVTLDITHTYIGDLRITLTAPSGSVVTLHDRQGGPARDIKRSFDVASTPGLAALAGQSMSGDWVLEIKDVAARDSGTLNSWDLEVGGRADALVRLEEAPGTAIPDSSPLGIERQLAAIGGGRVQEIEVAVDITHTYIGDLVVDLVSPAGTSVSLHRRSGGTTENLIARYSSASMPTFAALRGQPIAGSWRLKVADLEAADVGKLNRWSVTITPAP
jgi:subtilisin-like proprotein convertase family protein/subtilisin family serine protease